MPPLPESSSLPMGMSCALGQGTEPPTAIVYPMLFKTYIHGGPTTCQLWDGTRGGDMRCPYVPSRCCLQGSQTCKWITRMQWDMGRCSWWILWNENKNYYKGHAMYDQIFVKCVPLERVISPCYSSWLSLGCGPAKGCWTPVLEAGGGQGGRMLCQEDHGFSYCFSSTYRYNSNNNNNSQYY